MTFLLPGRELTFAVLRASHGVGPSDSKSRKSAEKLGQTPSCCSERCRELIQYFPHLPFSAPGTQSRVDWALEMRFNGLWIESFSSSKTSSFNKCQSDSSAFIGNYLLLRVNAHLVCSFTEHTQKQGLACLKLET